MGHELAPNESYTYGQRLTHYEIPEEWVNNWGNDKNKLWTKILIQDKEFWEDPKIIIQEDNKFYVNQIELLSRVYSEKGFRNNQMVLQIAHPSDMLLQDPPCLREIDTRIQEEKDGKTYLHFFPEFRSWDLWGGLPANLGGIELLKQYISEQIGVENGSMIAISGKTIEEAREFILKLNQEKEG
jgi:thymidylate synthase